MERELSAVLTLYEGALKEINLQVADFHAAHPREPFEIPDTYRQALREFLAQQITTEAYQAVLQFPQNSQVISIDLFIRDVFLYWAN
jgi:hypothetical protein